MPALPTIEMLSASVRVSWFGCCWFCCILARRFSSSSCLRCTSRRCAAARATAVFLAAASEALALLVDEAPEPPRPIGRLVIRDPVGGAFCFSMSGRFCMREKENNDYLEIRNTSTNWICLFVSCSTNNTRTCQLFARSRSMSRNISFTLSTCSITMSQKPCRSSPVVGNFSPGVWLRLL